MESIVDTRGSWPRVHDPHAWAEEQALFLRTGDADRIDCEGLAACLEALAASDLAAARELVRRVLTSFALFEFRPDEGGPSRRHCMAEAVSALHELAAILTPSLARRLEADYPILWTTAAARAVCVLDDLGADPSCIPAEPPFGWNDVFGEGGSLPV